MDLNVPSAACGHLSSCVNATEIMGTSVVQVVWLINVSWHALETTATCII